MPRTLSPNAEKLIADYLRTDDEVREVCTRIVSKTPSLEEDKNALDDPWVRYTVLNKTDVVKPARRWFQAYIQFDCYAGAEGGTPEAQHLGLVVRAALEELNEGEHNPDGAVVSEVDIRGDSRVADTQLDSRERQRISAAITMRFA